MQRDKGALPPPIPITSGKKPILKARKPRRLPKPLPGTFRAIDAEEENLIYVTKETWGALLDANREDPRLFRHGESLAYLPRPGEIPTGDDDPWVTAADPANSAQLIRVNLDLIRHLSARVATWYESQPKGKPDKIVMPPIAVMRDVLATPEPPLPILTKIVESPFFGRDGELYIEPGYHAAAQTYYAPPVGFYMPRPVPQRPAQANVASALAVIDELLRDFTFATPGDRVNAIALGLLPAARELIDDPTPNHLIEAPTEGSGKGLLAEVLLGDSAGPIGMIPQTDNEDEVRKAVTSRLWEGRSVILLDNVTKLASAVLATAFTARVWDDRMLGKNLTLRLPIRCVWVTTANNATLNRDHVRRAVRIRIDPGTEKPWLREDFHHKNLYAWAAEHRGELIWANLTLIQNWIARGRPASTSTVAFGSYPQWAEVMGGILGAAGVEGFLSNLLNLSEDADTEGEGWRGLAQLWWEKFQTKQVTASDLFPFIEDLELDLRGSSESALRTSFGMKLSQQRDRVIAGYRVVKLAKSRHGSPLWRLIPQNIGIGGGGK
jgi:putative DNA primase/helicase